VHCLFFSGSYVISGFHCEVDETCALLGYYTASSGNYLPAFWDNLLVPSLEVENQKDSRPLKVGLIGCPKTFVGNYHILMHNNPE
jgi:hypothetical protein